MADHTQNRVLMTARWLVYLIMTMLAVAGITLIIVSAILPFYWAEAAEEIAKEHGTLDIDALRPQLYIIFALGLIIISLMWSIMHKLLALVNCVADGDPFIRANARRLKLIGWLMLAIQIVGIPLATAARKTADLFGDNDVGLDLSPTGLLTILLVFILAGIFERGTEMREELEGTV